MDHGLTDLVHRVSNHNGVPVATYSTLYGIKSKFTVSASKFGEFIDGYCDLACEDERLDEGDGSTPTSLCIGEVVEGCKTLPVMGIFSFKFDVDEGDEERGYYGEDLPMRIAKCYQKAMSELLEISSNMHEYVCCVLDGHSYRKGGFVRRNLVLQFPFCQLDIKYAKKVFKPYVEKLLRQNRVSDAFETPPIGDWHDHLQDPEDTIPMYRSSAEAGVPHLTLTYVYGMVDDIHIEKCVGPELDLKSYFNPAMHSFIYNGKVPVKSVPIQNVNDEDPDDFAKFWLPMFLSIHFWTGQTNPKEVENSDSAPSAGVYDVTDSDSSNPIRMVMNLLPLLSADRANKDYSWLDVGRVLYTITNGGNDGLAMWINFSSKATVPGRDKNMCEYRYNEFKDNLLTVSTIAWYAKQDNPNGYTTWHTAWCHKVLNEALNITHADVAKAIYRCFWLEYIYSVDTGMWYQYRGHHFYKIGKEPIALRMGILDQFVPIFEKMRMDLSRGVYEAEHESGKKDQEFKIKCITELIKKLKNEGFRTTIVKSTKDFFNVEEFERKCDKNHFLTACSNCVLEVVDKRVRPRPGKPEDYILKYSTIMYPFDYTWDSYWVKEFLYWMDQITVGDKELKHYFLKRLSSFLRGLNPEKLFDVWTNAGNGGKSMLTKTLQFAFGAYFIDFPTAVLSGNGKNSSGPSPELAQANNARVAILAEPDDRESMKSGIIKRITGGDRIFTRALHENGGSMELTFKTILVCNRIPDIAGVDAALMRRFVIMPFLGQWLDDAPQTEEEQFRMRTFKNDPFFESKIPELAKAMIWILVNYYHYYANEGLPFPRIVREYIEKHWQDNDFYLQFISERIDTVYKDVDKKEVDIDVTLSAAEVYPFFNRWFKDYYPGVQVPTAAQFRSDISMSGRLGPQPKRGVWLGVKLRVAASELGGGLPRI